MPLINLYNIGSCENFSVTGREDFTKNLNLVTNPSATSGTLTGTVTSEGTPIIGATVKLFDSNNNPIEHTTTIESDNSEVPSGSYTFNNIPIGSYNVIAISEGFLLSNSFPVTIQNDKITNQDINLVPDPNANLNTIFGIVSSNINNKPIENAIVTISTIKDTSTLIGTSTTNDKGEYFFTNLPSGIYRVSATKSGFMSNESDAIKLDTNQFSNKDLVLSYDSKTNTGTVSGFITNSNNIPLSNATVLLYSIKGGVKDVIGITRTSTSGRYLFANVPPGDYQVKATVQTQAQG